MKVGVVGAAGRMGRMLLKETMAAADCTLAGGVEQPGHPETGTDLGRLAGLEPVGQALGDDAIALFAAADVVLDFTLPGPTAGFATLAAQGKTAHVIGTTGLGSAEEEALTLAARHTPIVYAPSMSLGVNLLMAITEKVAAALDQGFDIEILEMHHRHKVDAPSGTALGLGRAAAAGRRIDLDAHAVRSRDGHTGARRDGDIGFATLRGGDVVSEHTVVFAGQGERLELTHRGTSREIYALGALRAARWVFGKPPGLYGMADVLGLG